MEKLRQSMADSPFLRWGVLILVGFVLSTNYYFYDAFSTLKEQLLKEFNLSNTDYGLFVSFYSIPNTFLLMAVLGGIILDKLGIRRTGFLFVFSMAFGAFLTAYGASDYYQNNGFAHGFMESFWPSYSPELKMMLLGRFFFGLGAETSIVVISKVLVKWFKGKDLALAFGLKVGFGRLGTFLALRMSPVLAADKLNVAIWFAAILVLAGLLAFCVYILIDLRHDQQKAVADGPEVKKVVKESFKITDITTLLTNRTYIYIALLCVTFYSAVFPFLAFAPDFFANKFGMTAVESGNIASYLPLATLIFTPFFGFLIDRFGRSATAMIFGSFVLLIVHSIFAFTDIHPLVPMLMLGVAFSLVPAAMWPSTVRLVNEQQIGTAYGLMYSIQNLGLWAFPLLAGYILDVSNAGKTSELNYTPTILMFAALSLVGLFFAFMLKRDDMKYKKGVDLPMNKKD